MDLKDNGFVRGRMRSLKFALKGVWLLISTEHSIMVQLFIAVCVTLAGWYYGLSALEWMLQVLAIGMVLVAESINTVVEKLCDFIHKDYHKKIEFIKDISAGAVTFAAVSAIIIGLIIYLPKIL